MAVGKSTLSGFLTQKGISVFLEVSSKKLFLRKLETTAVIILLMEKNSRKYITMHYQISINLMICFQTIKFKVGAWCMESASNTLKENRTKTT